MKYDKLYIFCYDVLSTVEGNKRRAKFEKFLRGHAVRVQGSVFEGRLESKAELDKIIKKAKQILNLKEDSLRVYPIFKDAEADVQIIGLGEIFTVKDEYIF